MGFGTAMATYTCDGELRYAAGGGLRPVLFPCNWSTEEELE